MRGGRPRDDRPSAFESRSSRRVWTTQSMAGSRLVNVYWRGDGSILYSEVWGQGTLPVESKNGGSEPVSAGTVWSLVQVFIQFAREVDGGNVQRLIFRNPVQPVGKHHAFDVVRTGLQTVSQRPVLIHVANDDLFVVTVTEALPAYNFELRSVAVDFPAGLLAHEVLLYVATQQANFQSRAAERRTPLTASPSQDALMLASGAEAPTIGVDYNVALPESTSPRGQPVISRATVQPSYVSDTSDSESYASQPSLSISQDSYSSFADDQRAVSESHAGVPRMMPFERSVLRTEVKRIVESFAPPYH
jgi:hypothetical protein